MNACFRLVSTGKFACFPVPGLSCAVYRLRQVGGFKVTVNPKASRRVCLLSSPVVELVTSRPRLARQQHAPCIKRSVRPCVRWSVRPCVRWSVRPCVHLSDTGHWLWVSVRHWSTTWDEPCTPWSMKRPTITEETGH